MSRLKPLSLSIHIFGSIFEEMLPLVSVKGMACFCELQDIDTRDLVSNPPTSERPRCNVLYACYTAIDILNNDILLVIFQHYRSDNVISWNAQLGWRKLSQVCQRWRHLIYRLSLHLGLQIVCTNGAPLVDTLVHLPPLPLVVDYRYTTATIDAQDKLGIFHVLHLRDRLYHVALSIPPSNLRQLLWFMDGPFPVLEYLSLSPSSEEGLSLLLPKTLMAPNLRHLTLVGIGLSDKLLFLSSTLALVTLTLENIRGSSYFPQHLVARLKSLFRLEELTIDFTVTSPPHPGDESELLQDMEVPVTLPLLKRLTFRGIGPYLDSFVAQIRAPHLQQLDITLFHLFPYTLPHLSHFINTTEELMLPIAKIIFENDAVSIVLDRGEQQGDETSIFSLEVVCHVFNWQVDCAAQICSALGTIFSGVKQLTLDFERQLEPEEWLDGDARRTIWRSLLQPFTGARRLRILGRAIAWELSHASQSSEGWLDAGLLPSLKELAVTLDEEHEDIAFASFIEARQIAGHPVLLSVLQVSRSPSVEPSIRLPHTPSTEFFTSPLQSRPSTRASWVQRTIIKPFRKRFR